MKDILTNNPSPQGARRSAKDQIHSFSLALARQHGVNAAILLGFLANRIDNQKALTSGKLRFYHSLSDLAERYPYMKRTTISDTLNRLKDKVLEISAMHNKRSYDRTHWFAFLDEQVFQEALSGQLRYFSKEDAIAHGVASAIILRNLIHWVVEKRKRDPGYSYHSLSPSALTSLLPYSESTIKRAIREMVEGRVIRPDPSLKKGEVPRYCLVDENRLNDTEPTTTLRIQQKPNPYTQGSNPNDEGSKSNDRGSDPDKGGSNPDDYTVNRRVTSQLENQLGKESYTQTSSAVCASHPSREVVSSSGSMDRSSAKVDACPPSLSKENRSTSDSATVEVGPTNTTKPEQVSSGLDYSKAPSINPFANIPHDQIDSPTPSLPPSQPESLLDTLSKKNQVWIKELEERKVTVQEHVLFFAGCLFKFTPPEKILSIRHLKVPDQILQEVTPLVNSFDLRKIGTKSTATGEFLREVLKEWWTKAVLRFHNPLYISGHTGPYQVLLLMLEVLNHYVESEKAKELQREHQLRKQEFVSPDATLESAVDLSPYQKTRVFVKGIQALNQVGIFDVYGKLHQHFFHQHGANYKPIQTLFKKNPELTPAHLLRVLEKLIEVKVDYMKQVHESDTYKCTFQIDSVTRFLINMEAVVHELGCSDLLPTMQFLSRDEILVSKAIHAQTHEGSEEKK